MADVTALLTNHHDSRIETLAGIKTRSFGADTLVLSALTVLAYAQLEGGVKDLSACAIEYLNVLGFKLGEISLDLLRWRNQKDIENLKSMVDFEMIGSETPFSAALSRPVRLTPINRQREYNQMTWPKLMEIYAAFGLDCSSIERSAAMVNNLVKARNDAAHHGVLPRTAAAILEAQLRENVTLVEKILTDLSIQLIVFFESHTYRRRPIAR